MFGSLFGVLFHSMLLMSIYLSIIIGSSLQIKSSVMVLPCMFVTFSINIQCCRYGPVWITTTLVFHTCCLRKLCYLSDPPEEWTRHSMELWCHLCELGCECHLWLCSCHTSRILLLASIFGIEFKPNTPMVMWGYYLFIFIPTSVSIQIFDSPI